MGFFPGTQEQVWNSCGKQAISVRATEVPLYVHTLGEVRQISIMDVPDILRVWT